MENSKEVLMYVAARQFKRAIDKDEMIIIPKNKNMILDNSIINFGIFTATVRGNEFISKIYPFIVNKSFACELYLKTILKMNGQQIPRGNRGHMLNELFNEVCEKEKLLENISKSFRMKKDLITEEINGISKAFEEWRYIYEKDENQLNYGFLNGFCDFLDDYVKNKILNERGYDVTKDCR